MNEPERLARTAPPPPVRLVHLGLGAFFRAHQAWYTAHAGDADRWGVAAFTGRSAAGAIPLDEQGGLYTLVVRGADGDRDEVIGSVAEARDGADTEGLARLLADPEVAVVTLTVTEAGYRLGVDGAPDPDDPALAADLAALRPVVRDGLDLASARPTTTPGRLLLGLEARRRSGASPLAIVPCDNLPGNGALLAASLGAAARALDPGLAGVVEAQSFVSTSVDRITPRTTAADLEGVEQRTGRLDRAPVVTEPFTDWVLAGAFPGGRPRWEDAGARFVDDVEPWEKRKLWLLNGAHTLLAAAGPARGHDTVAQAIGDPVLRAAVERFWDEAVRHLPAGLDIPAYRAALLVRFENPRIEHRLAQIAEDGTRKLRLRIVPVAEAERAAGRDAAGCAAAVAAWAGQDGTVVAAGGIPLAERIAAVSPRLAADDGFVTAVAQGALRAG